MNAISKLFKNAEEMRTEESRKMSLKELCDKMALDAGWHTVYVPNNRSKVKDRVKYSKSLDEHLFCELLVRFEKKIYQQFIDRDGIYMEQAPSKIFDCALRFMNSYNPNLCNSDAQIVNRMCTSIRQRAIECHFEEYTKYNFDGINANEKSEDQENPNKRDWRCAVNISLQSTFKIGKNGDEKTLESILEDTNYSRNIGYQSDLAELMEKYASTDYQKLLLEILISEGKKMTPAKLLREFKEETNLPEKEVKNIVYNFYHNLKNKLIATL